MKVKHAFVYKHKDYVYKVAVEADKTLYILNDDVSGCLALHIADRINESKVFDRPSFSSIAELFSK